MRPLALGPDELGECARWVGGELWRVDILSGLTFRVMRPTDLEPEVVTESFDGEVGFALPRVDGGAVVGVERRLWLVDPDGQRRALLDLDERSENRWNDAICDRRGRLWAGTFARDRSPGASNLYRIDPDGSCERVLDGLTIANGLGWLDDGATLHFVDSPAQRVDRFEVDVDAGRLHARRALVAIGPAEGAPDGLCIDEEECTWVALFGGGVVNRYDRDGAKVEERVVPVPHPTSPCLGGDHGRELFLTTTRHRLDPARREALTDAGRVFHADAGVRGTAVLPFYG